MKEKELRLALVCYGGVSLAVYMHGVTKEILKLVRASRILHSERNISARMSAAFDNLEKTVNGDSIRESDTERVYFDLLQAIGATLDLRVFVDTIAGASAGGINGVLLARALAHDLSLDQHRKIWLEQADILALMDSEHIAGKWSKFFMRPLFWAFNNRLLTRFAPDAEMRQKVMLFMRSRWFEPPFSGKNLTNMLLDACRSMGEHRPDASLVPAAQKLELIVSVTDFYGYRQSIPIHDPPSIKEREHRHILKFTYLQHARGRFEKSNVETEFDDDHVPGLVFAARATASFPGAFPAAQIGEIDDVLRERGEKWPTRMEFIQEEFKPFIASGADPEKVSFIDGSVLNNKPFVEAIAAIRGRPAYRQVDRRIVYIDPDPEGGHLEAGGAAPGFFQTIRGALSDIPRNQPVRDELESVHQFSERVRQYRQIVEATRPHVAERVRELVGEPGQLSPDPDTLANWRNRANSQAALEAGYAYDGYIQLKVSYVLERILNFIVNTSGAVPQPSQRLILSRAIETWAKEKDIFPVRWEQVNGKLTAPTAEMSWVHFLRDFDLTFRIRRVRFVIRRLNELYEIANVKGEQAFKTDPLDKFKTSLYDSLELLQAKPADCRFNPEIAAMCAKLMAHGNPEMADIDALLGRIGPLVDLVGTDVQIDKTFAMLSGDLLPDAARRDLMLAYVGFPFFDVLTLPLNKWDDLDDVDTVRVDRISPEDAKAIREGGAQKTLMGRELEHFAAFFSRRARENDYLWGRLHAADRLVDIVASAAPAATIETIDLKDIKARLFRAILKTEKSYLTSAPDIIHTIEGEIDNRLGPARDAIISPKL